MPKYVALRDTWLSHECRGVKAGEQFTTTFPKRSDGKEMVLSDNLKLVKELSAADKKAAAANEEAVAKATAVLEEARATGTDVEIAEAEAALEALQKPLA